MTTEFMIFVYIAIGSAVSAVVASFFTYLGTKKKSMSSGFTSILQANERFRQEIKVDLDASRKDSDRLRHELDEIENKYKYSIEKISELQQTIINYQKEITELKTTIHRYQSEISILKSVIDDYKIEVEKLREELSKMNNKKSD